MPGFDGGLTGDLGGTAVVEDSRDSAYDEESSRSEF